MKYLIHFCSCMFFQSPSIWYKNPFWGIKTPVWPFLFFVCEGGVPSRFWRDGLLFFLLGGSFLVDPRLFHSLDMGPGTHKIPPKGRYPGGCLVLNSSPFVREVASEFKSGTPSQALMLVGWFHPASPANSRRCLSCINGPSWARCWVQKKKTEDHRSSIQGFLHTKNVTVERIGAQRVFFCGHLTKTDKTEIP